MPANLTPEYFKAEKWFRSADSSDEKILALERMLSVMPKHKGTDHLRADLRKKLSKLREAPAKKQGGAHVDIFHVPRGGAGQVVLIGTPNCGKSSLVGALTNAKVHIADFQFATNSPVPGMVLHEDVPIQLVDMPPITADIVMPGQVGTYRNCEVIAIVIDLSGDVGEQLQVCVDFLESRSLLVDEETPSIDDHGNSLGKKAFCILTKSDIAAEAAVEKFRQLSGDRFEYIEVSAYGDDGLDELPVMLFKQLDIVRVYARPPGKKADMTDPFTLPKGSTVMDLATVIHREMAQKLRFARIWGTGVYDGQNTQRTHVLNDKDIIELHFG